MNTSEQINELAAAMAKAQGEITGALKDSANPFFKSKYADLASCWDACRDALSKNGIAVIQSPEWSENTLALTTTLAHSSGQWMRSTLPVNPKDDGPQAMGSAITYARRYALCAFVGVSQIDDDGNSASVRNQAYIEPHRPQPDTVKLIDASAAEGIAAEMRKILSDDVDEDLKAAHVADKNDLLNKNQELYMAAADRLLPKERASWKAYVGIAKKRQAAEPMAANGRRTW